MQPLQGNVFGALKPRVAPRGAQGPPAGFSTLSLPGLSMITVHDRRRVAAERSGLLFVIPAEPAPEVSSPGAGIQAFSALKLPN